MKRKTRDEFIADARKVHGNKYDYSQVDYVSTSENVCIICPIHGTFYQKPYHHLLGQGCRQCAGTEQMDTLSFVWKAKKVHGNKFDYSKVNYVNTRTKVCIFCPEHGEFWQTPHRHLRGDGCAKCSGLKKKNTEQFIRDAISIHGNKYDYRKVDYINSSTKVIISCPIHGEFEQTPNSHLSGSGCPNCGGTQKLSVKDFIVRAKEIHGFKYNYSKVQYINNRTPVLITCLEHGDFLQSPESHLAGCGCRICAHDAISKAKLKDTATFIADARSVHGDKYDYSKVEYSGNNKKICIGCPEHGEFWQTPHCHLSGKGCPLCNNSILENELRQTLIDNNIRFIKEHTFPWLKYKKCLRLDFYLPENKIAIECQGIQHFEPIETFGGIKAFKETKSRDICKRCKCQSHGIKIIYYSNLGIRYPYPVYEDINEIIQFIKLQQISKF